MVRAPTELYNTDSRNTADKLAAMPKSYGDVPRLGPPLPGDLGRPIVNAQNQGKIVPTPGMGPAPSGPSPEENARAQARQRAARAECKDDAGTRARPRRRTTGDGAAPDA